MKYYCLLVSFLFFQIGFAQLDIFDVARKGTIEEVKIIMKQSPGAINSVNKEGYSPLILACYKGNVSVARFLIQNVEDINGSSAMGTPLMAAVVKKNTEIVKMLLDNKANTNLIDVNGTTALIYAVQLKDISSIKLLIKYGADKSKIDNKGKTAFEYAVFSNDEEIVNLFK